MKTHPAHSGARYSWLCCGWQPEEIGSMWLISRLVSLFFDIRNHGGLEKTLNSFEGINTYDKNENETLWR